MPARTAGFAKNRDAPPGAGELQVDARAALRRNEGMNLDVIPIWALGLGTIAIVLVAIEAGFRYGEASRHDSSEEKESPLSAISAALLGLVAFMLAFTFGAVTQRFDERRAIVRNEANAIGTAFLRSDFLPEAERIEAVRLLREYTDIRIVTAVSRDATKLPWCGVARKTTTRTKGSG